MGDLSVGGGGSGVGPSRRPLLDLNCPPSPDPEPSQEPNQNQISRRLRRYLFHNQTKFDSNNLYKKAGKERDFIRRVQLHLRERGLGERDEAKIEEYLFSGQSLRVPTLQKLIAQVTEDPFFTGFASNPGW